MDPFLLKAGASQPPTWGYLHTGIVRSIDFVSADGGHWHIAPELGARGREEGQGVHAAQRWADHNWRAQVQGIHHSCQEAAGDQFPDRGRGCCFLGAPQACRDSGVGKTRALNGENGRDSPFLQEALLGQSLSARFQQHTVCPSLFLQQPRSILSVASTRHFPLCLCPPLPAIECPGKDWSLKSNTAGAKPQFST